ncbi:ferritin-like domain-containing protein [Gramella sp. GC03-9]|uniref:Ferritin-like domain-containing protein n=1 Tax=Christiangramia oceanisediminis TaxID=2920386 RepID=A0A9X2I5H7_9FLAO|nr:ferritin-like domain-containing protein [Gramella oceanisediminis]MCP9199772.1 ferritin-like domain-containing protein [Gramella oceanisediminis]
MRNLEDLFEHQLKDLYNAEGQLVNALPKMRSAAHNGSLKKIFEDHLNETRQHIERLREICKELDIDPKGEECNAMKGIIREGEEFMELNIDPDVKDAGLISEAQRIEHYEIAGYGTLVQFAEELGYADIAEKLTQNRNEAYRTDERFNELAKERLNRKAR